MKGLMILTVIMLLMSCNHYYKATLRHANTDLEKAALIDSLNNEKRYFILRNGNSGYFMRNAQISNDKTTITSTLQTAGVDHRLHFVHGRSGNYQYRNKIPNERHVLDEVHFYLPVGAKIRTGPSNLPVNSIEKIEIIVKDKKRTFISAVAGVVVGLMGAAGLVTLLFLGWVHS